MIQNPHVNHKWHVFVIMFFMSCPEPPKHISGLDSFPAWSGGSLINFPTVLGVGSWL